MTAAELLNKILLAALTKDEVLTLLAECIRTLCDHQEGSTPKQEQQPANTQQRPPEGSGRVVLEADTTLTCLRCQSHIYKITKPIRERDVSIDYIRSAFRSLGNWPGVPPQGLEILPYKGGHMIKCPKCKTFTVPLINPTAPVDLNDLTATSDTGDGVSIQTVENPPI